MEEFGILEQQDNEIQEIRNKKNLVIKTFREDIRFYQIALNLSGKRDDLLDKAMDLVRREGSILNALIFSRKIGNFREIENEQD